MSSFWVVSRFTPRFWDLAPVLARQLERRGYLVWVAHDTTRYLEQVRALVVLAAWPRWRWWLECVRWVSVQFGSQHSQGGWSRGAL